MFCQRPDKPWNPPSLLLCEQGVLFPRLRWPGREVYRQPPSISEVKN